MKNWITGQEARIIEQDSQHYMFIATLLKQPYITLGNNGYSIDILKLCDEIDDDHKKELIGYLSNKLKN